MCQCRCILHNKCTNLVSEVENVGDYAGDVRPEIFEKSLHVPFNFFSKTKTVLKNSL